MKHSNCNFDFICWARPIGVLKRPHFPPIVNMNRLRVHGVCLVGPLGFNYMRD